MNFTPLNDRLLLQPLPPEEVTKNGIVIPDTAKKKPIKGRVISQGEDCKTDFVGKIVLYGKYIGTEINLEGTDYLIVKQEDILGYFEND